MNSSPSGFRPVPRTGVIYVVTEATKLGYSSNNPQWANLGQGAPETGPLPGGAKRIHEVKFSADDHEYAPVDGLLELRERVAELYNYRYRQGKKSQYTKDNVAICSGGRLALTRLVSTLGRTNVGHFLPDYTAYEELLDAFGTFVPIPILLNPDSDYRFSVDDFQNELLGRGLSSILLSNPCNPTGKLIHGDELRDWVAIARSAGSTLILDEFYSHYTYLNDRPTVSAAEFVDDVDSDPVVILDGLTKNWRYPGWRISWTVAPKTVIESVASAGSFLDGGSARPLQVATLPLLEPSTAEAEAAAIQRIFSEKRRLMLDGLSSLGITVRPEPLGGFYCWGNLSELPEPINTGMGLFRRALQEKVIIVPGQFFDINPGHRRPDRSSRFGAYARFSFGPTIDVLKRGLDCLARAIRNP